MADIGIPAGIWDVPNQRLWWDGKPGLCTPSIDNNTNLLVGWSYQTGYFNWQIEGAADDGDLLSPDTNTEVELYTTSLGDTIPGAWWIQGPADTNLPTKQEGSPVCRGNVFFASGMIVEALFPVAKFEDTATSDLYEPAWLKDGENGPGYGSRIQRANLNRVSISVKHNNPIIDYPIGPARLLPGWPGVEGQANTRNGSIGVISYVPFATPIAFGSKDDCRQLSVTLKFGQHYRIESDTTQPTDVENVTGGILYTGIMVTLLGKVCTDLQQVLCVAPVSQPTAAIQSNNPSAAPRW
jgi:hypothetical protein